MQAIAFNGSSQYGRVTFPSGPPYSALTSWRFEAKMRAVRIPFAATQRIFYWNNVARLFISSGSTFIALVSNRGADNISASVNANLLADPTELLLRAQYNGTQFTLELWNLDGSGHIQGTAAASGSFDGSAQNLFIAAFVDASNVAQNFLQANYEWARLLIETVPVGSAAPGDTPPAGTYLARWEFEGDGLDSSGAGNNLTLVNSPTFLVSVSGSVSAVIPVSLSASGKAAVSGSLSIAMPVPMINAAGVVAVKGALIGAIPSPSLTALGFLQLHLFSGKVTAVADFGRVVSADAAFSPLLGQASEFTPVVAREAVFE